MFYGDKSIEALAKLLPFSKAEKTVQAKKAKLEVEASAITCRGYSRQYKASIVGQPCATIEETAGAELKAFGLMLDQSQQITMDQLAGRGFQSKRLIVKVLQHKNDLSDKQEESVAQTYQMLCTDGDMDTDATFVRKCMAATDMQHYKIRGIPVRASIQEAQLDGTIVTANTRRLE